MKLRRATESRKSRRSLECLGADDLERVTGSSTEDADRGSADLGGQAARMIDKRSQMFDMLRQIIDKYNQTAKGIIDSMGR